MKLHRLLLDYDGLTKEQVERDAKQLLEAYPELGGYIIEPSKTTLCFRVIFPKSMLEWERALEIAEQSRCDREWIKFCKRYKVFAGHTKLSRSLQDIKPKPKNRPVEEVDSPVKLIVKPHTELDLKRVIKLSESIDDPEWKWKIEYPIIGVRKLAQVVIGCRDGYQLNRRVRFFNDTGIKADFQETWK